MPVWNGLFACPVVMLDAALLLKLQRWPAVIELQQIKTCCRTHRTLKLHHCCKKSSSPVHSKFDEARLGTQSPKLENLLSLPLSWTLCYRDRQRTGHLLIHILLIFNLCPNCTKCDTAPPQALTLRPHCSHQGAPQLSVIHTGSVSAAVLLRSCFVRFLV